MNDTLGSYFVPRTDGRHSRRYYSNPAWSHAETAAMYRMLLRDAKPRHRAELSA